MEAEGPRSITVSPVSSPAPSSVAPAEASSSSVSVAPDWVSVSVPSSAEQGQRYSYRQFANAVDDVAKGLMAVGVAKGDRVGIWSPNYAEWVLLQYATARIGAILVTINPAYRVNELEYALNQSGISLLVAAPSYLTSDYRAMIAGVRDRVPCERVVYLPVGEEPSSDWAELVSQGASVSDGQLEARTAELHPDDPINIQYTSGTTGFPKGATLSHRNILNNGFFIGEACGYSDASSNNRSSRLTGMLATGAEDASLRAARNSMLSISP